MNGENYDVFISYRRKDTDLKAGMINNALKARFIRCFYDFDELKDRKFDEKILRAIEDAPLFMALLSPAYFSRCNDDEDWVRKEITQALKLNKKVIPINVDNLFREEADVPAGVPDNIRSGILGHQFSEVYTRTTFQDNIDALIRDRIKNEFPNIGITPGNKAKVELSSDVNCNVIKGGEEIAQLQADGYNHIYLDKGNHRLVFRSVKYPDIETKEKITIPEVPYEDFIEVEMQSLVSARENQEKEELRRREEEQKRKEEEAKGYKSFSVGGVEFNMIKVEGGTFRMGATEEQGSDAWDGEKPVHSVTLSDYYIGQTEVTQELWVAVMGSNPSKFKGNNQCPVESVSWEDCQEFIKKLNRLTGENFRLPTEAEWEFAARGGNKSKGYKYSGSNTASDVAWYNDNSGGETHAVATKQANELGLYDMSGNVWEWCSDRYGVYQSSSQTNPKGPSSGIDRVLRGGCWGNRAWGVRVSDRNDRTPSDRFIYRGLRLSL